MECAAHSIRFPSYSKALRMSAQAEAPARQRLVFGPRASFFALWGWFFASVAALGSALEEGCAFCCPGFSCFSGMFHHLKLSIDTDAFCYTDFGTSYIL